MEYVNKGYSPAGECPLSVVAAPDPALDCSPAYNGNLHYMKQH